MIIAEINVGPSIEKKYFLQNKLYDFLGKKYKKFYFINTYNIRNKKKLKINYQFFKKKNIIHFNPKSFSELNIFLSKNNIFLINNLSFGFRNIFLHYLVSRKNIFQISFSNILQFNSYKVENWTHVNLVKKIKFYYSKRFSLFVYRILIILRLINQIDILCISQKDIYKNYKSSYNKKTLLIKKYKEIKSTSVKLPFINTQKKQYEKYITFIDTGILHMDILRRGHIINKKMVNDYLSYLKTYLLNLNKLFRKKIVICLHPSSNYNLYKKKLRDFEIYKYKTEKYISNSFLVLFHDSTAIFSAILLNKKIISLKSNIMGNYLNARRLFYIKKFFFEEHNIEQNLKLNRKKLTIQLNKKVKNYEKIIKKIYFSEKNSLSIQKIMDNEIQKYKIMLDKY